MEITLNSLNAGPNVEDYSEYEEDEVLGVLSDVCAQIDQKGIARFSAIFSAWDDRFNKMDFLYDFTSIASELKPLLDFLRTQKGTFILHFYELDRKVVFKFLNEGFGFQISQSMSDVILFHGALDFRDLEMKIENVMEAFKGILRHNFPLALENFKRNGFLFW